MGGRLCPPLRLSLPIYTGRELGLDLEFESLWAAFKIQIPCLGPKLCCLCRWGGAPDVKTPQALLPLTAPACVVSSVRGFTVTRMTAEP